MAKFIAICICAVAAAAFSLSMAKAQPELSYLLGITLALVGIFLLAAALREVITIVNCVAEGSNLGILKSVIVAAVSKPLAEQCKASGQSGAAAAVEYAALAAVITLCAPYIGEVISYGSSLFS